MDVRWGPRGAGVLAIGAGLVGAGALVAGGLAAGRTGSDDSTGPRAQEAAVHAFVGVDVVPMDTERVLADRTVIVEGDRITTIGPARSVDVPAEAVRIDGEGLFLMPGLAEMHAHIPGGDTSREYLENTLFLYVANGITTIRGMLGEPAHLELREAAESGDLLSPRIYTSGPSLNGNSVTSPERAREMVREQAAAGYDFLKLHPGLSRESFDAMDAMADEAEMPFAGHVSLGVGLERTLEARQATIDHLDGYVEAMAPAGAEGSQFFGLNLVGVVDLERLPELARSTAEAGVGNVPTQALVPEFFGDPQRLRERPDVRYVPPQQLSGWVNAVTQQQANPLFSAENGTHFMEIRRRILGALHEAGAEILLGSDAPQVFNVPGFSIHEELEEYVLAGLSPFEALRTGTVNVARHFGAEGERGTVAEGMVADLILVRANPLEDVGNVADPAGVMLRGRWLPAEELGSRLEALAAGYGN